MLKKNTTELLISRSCCVSHRVNVIEIVIFNNEIWKFWVLGEHIVVGVVEITPRIRAAEAP